ncbi:MAG: phosphoribosylanthranilate isomerase, partial [Halobacteria archaeon]|nr:phosphoribosylanthranilate isomerase [Halobacteria archaeon]
APDVSEARKYADSADALILDSSGDDGGGGTGETHDWDKSAEVVREVDVPIVLAGGLESENVGEAVEAVEPYGVDVASGVEDEDREGKDEMLVNEFVENAKHVEDAKRV